jgi:hypothetical protein
MIIALSTPMGRHGLSQLLTSAATTSRDLGKIIPRPVNPFANLVAANQASNRAPVLITGAP